MNMAKFATLYSGSSGNSAYITDNHSTLLIDCGKNCKTTVNALYEHGETMNNVCGILLTHEHWDHIAGLSVMLRHFPVPVYGPGPTLEFLVRENLVPRYATLIPVCAKVPFYIKEFGIVPFFVSHDSLGAFGYRITTNSGKNIAYATDTGEVTSEIFDALQNSDLVALEANYDELMLKYGRYPAFLKKRISADRGHLCNDDSATAVVKLASNGCKRFVMCHLSAQNNEPEKILLSLSKEFLKRGLSYENDVDIEIAPRQSPSKPFIL